MSSSGSARRRVWASGAGVLVWALAASFGCGPPAPPPVEPEPPARGETREVPLGPDPCQAYCDRADGCRHDSGADPDPGCLAQCGKLPSAPRAALRGDYLWAQARCLDLLDCAGIASAGPAVGGCQTLARHDLVPSEGLRSFCAEATRRGAKCEQDPDQGDCIERLRIFGEAALSRAGRCLERPCAEVPGCVQQALYGVAR